VQFVVFLRDFVSSCLDVGDVLGSTVNQPAIESVCPNRTLVKVIVDSEYTIIAFCQFSTLLSSMLLKTSLLWRQPFIK
jgi:hypothetical protein